jgi:hypothetical protein
MLNFNAEPTFRYTAPNVSADFQIQYNRLAVLSILYTQVTSNVADLQSFFEDPVQPKI